MSSKKKVQRLALAMAQTLPGYMMPRPSFSEADDPWEGDHDSAFGSRDGRGEPIMALGGKETLGEAKVRHYLEERGRARRLYLKLAEEILDRVEVIKGETGVAPAGRDA